MSFHQSPTATNLVAADAPGVAQESVDVMLRLLSDGLDHPEMWELVPKLAAEHPDVVEVLEECAACEPSPRQRVRIQTLLGLATVARKGVHAALDVLTPLETSESQNVQVQGAIFYLEGLLDPENPKYQLADKVCLVPFVQLDVLERTTHLCCASWLPTSTGDLSYTPAEEIWNGNAARSIRASMLDGSYRHCNKRTCPLIQGNQLTPLENLKADSRWSEIVSAPDSPMPGGPEKLNLSYDRTCNLSCPSCRTTRYAADDATRARFDQMQQREILPLLRKAKSVYVTGSGDPFASKNFRRLMEQLTPDEYPELRFILMTNGMLLTPRQWEQFPALHRRVEMMRISLDAATGPTHELLRRGARWSVMEENLRFAGRLLADGQIDHFMLCFVVQQENYTEMGSAIDLAREVGASSVYFSRITNWGTFSHDEYTRKAVFVPTHPEYNAFVEAAKDPRLNDALRVAGELDEFFSSSTSSLRAY